MKRKRAGTASRGTRQDTMPSRGRSAVRTPPPPAGPQQYSAVTSRAVAACVGVEDAYCELNVLQPRIYADWTLCLSEPCEQIYPCFFAALPPTCEIR